MIIENEVLFRRGHRWHYIWNGKISITLYPNKAAAIQALLKDIHNI